jgi:ABC-type polar amino acid transport system ATPase subunit
MSGGQQQRVAIAAFSKSTIRLLDGTVQANGTAH